MSSHLTWHDSHVRKEDREKLNGHRGFVLWFTGLSGSGKSTLSAALELELHQQGVRTYRLDGDNVRMGLNQNLGFSAADRAENIRRVGEAAKLMADAGLVTLTAFISPYEKDREGVKASLGEDVAEVFVKAPLAVCEERDPKGLYKKARTGEIRNFTGIDDPYEEPEAPELTLDTGKDSIEKNVSLLITYLQEKGVISSEANNR
ncbi:adenylyl-sulfate kinase [Bacillus daqingensis]|uniref:Adenylyl-sulfate kinase n=1 Tax=Bacillus daqingensis TaxID=872396 RepID=A0ABV9NT90_9BACI